MKTIDTAVGAVARAARTLDPAQGRIARRNARDRVLRALAALRRAVDRDYPPIRSPGRRKVPIRNPGTAQIDQRMAARGLTYVGSIDRLAEACARVGVRLTEAYGRTFAPAWAWAVWRLPPADYEAKVRRLQATRRGGTAAKRAALAEYALAAQPQGSDEP